MSDEYVITNEWQAAPKHSGVGIASFVAGLLVAALALVLIAAAGVAEATTPGGMDEESPTAIVIGLGIFACVIGALIGGVLGVVGLVQHDRRKLFGVLGLALNGLIVLGLGLLVVIGLVAQAAGG